MSEERHIWFNPSSPLFDKDFPKDKRLSKISNRTTIKVSHSYLPHVKQTVSNNNIRLLHLRRMKESTQIANYVGLTVGKKKLAHLTASASLNALYIKKK